MELKKIRIMASYDWSMRLAFKRFTDYLDPVIRWKGKEYKIDMGNIIANPVKCGEDISKEADYIIDRTVHWNDYYKFWAQQAINCGMHICNHPNTFENHDKHHTYDLMARAMHPADRFPTTVLLPQFNSYTADQKNAEMWSYYQSLITSNTKFGWDDSRRTTNWTKINETLERTKAHMKKAQKMRNEFYPHGDYIRETMEKYFNNQYPVYFKKAFGGGGSNVYKVKNLEELYEKYDESNGKAYHIQEAIEGYEDFIRCMAIGPQILPMRFQPDEPLHQHYSPEKLKVKKDIYHRLSRYVMFQNAYHRWTYNSFEALVKDNQIHPIDFANACPDSNFTSLHTHFPWLMCALIKWCAYNAVVSPAMKIDLQQREYLDVLNNPKISQEEKFNHCAKLSESFFNIPEFNDFVQENFADIEKRFIEFYDNGHFDEIVQYAIIMSDFPEYEQEKFYNYYSDMMNNMFRKNAEEYLTTVIYSE